MVRTDGPARPGSTYEERSRVVGPISAKTAWEVIECEEPRRQVHRTTSIPVLKPLDVVMKLEPASPESTRFTIAWRGEPALGPVGALAVRAQRSSFERDIATTADNIAAAAEGA